MLHCLSFRLFSLAIVLSLYPFTPTLEKGKRMQLSREKGQKDKQLSKNHYRES
jgi:hypothetical protein